MSNLPTAQYLKTQVMTASPEVLQLMLWDGAIRFAEQGKAAVTKKDFEGSYTALVKAQKIIMELNTSLKHDVSPELCKNLAGLYTFIYLKLVEGNTKREIPPIEDALKIMRHQRETWVMLMEKVSQEKISTAQENLASSTAAGAIEQAELPRPVIAGGARRGYPSMPLKPAGVAPALSVQG